MVFQGIKKYPVNGSKIKGVGCLTGQPTAYKKLEFEIEVEALEGNIFDYEHISLELEFKSPEGKVYKHPAFFFRGYEFEDLRLVNPKPEDDGWRIRITPKESGEYSAALRLFEDGGLTDEVLFSFNVGDNDDKRGNVGVEPVNRKTFCFEDGTPYIAIGQNACWSGWDVVWDKEDSKNTTLYLEQIYRRMGDHKANWTRLWMSQKYNSVIPLGSDPADLYPALGRGILNDRLLEACAENGIYLDLVFFSHGIFINNGSADRCWGENPFNIDNGGYLENTGDFFNDERAKKDTKQYIRYMIARHGYSCNLFCWELFNEADAVEADPDDVINWHREMTAFIRENDCHGHMITTSACRNRSPLIFDDIYDFISMHRYSEPDNVKLIVHEAYMASSEFDRPILVAESGNSWRGPIMSEITRHHSVWTGIMGNTAGTAMNWWWDRVEKYENEIGKPLICYKDFAIAAEYAKRIPRNAEGCRFVMRERLACNKPFVEAMGYNGRDFAYIWLYDSRFTRKNPIDETVEVGDFEVILENGEYTAEWIDTWTGESVEKQIVTVKGNFARFSSPSFKRDIAVAIEKINN